jgi:hypothetical protein
VAAALAERCSTVYRVEHSVSLGEKKRHMIKVGLRESNLYRITIHGLTVTRISECRQY